MSWLLQVYSCQAFTRKVSAEADRSIEGVLYPTLLEYKYLLLCLSYSVVRQDEGNTARSKHKKLETWLSKIAATHLKYCKFQKLFMVQLTTQR